MNITAADVNKLRQITGAGMMDCKKALTEAEGDFDAAIDLLRKKGQKVAANRGDREATEGVILAKLADGGKTGVMIALNCETDFVAKNADFVAVASHILETAPIPRNEAPTFSLYSGTGSSYAKRPPIADTTTTLARARTSILSVNDAGSRCFQTTPLYR